MKKGVFDYISKGSSNEKIMENINKGLEHGKKLLINELDETSIEPVLKYTVFCNHSLITERLYNFSQKSLPYKIFPLIWFMNLGYQLSPVFQYYLEYLTSILHNGHSARYPFYL